MMREPCSVCERWSEAFNGGVRYGCGSMHLFLLTVMIVALLILFQYIVFI